MILTNAAGEVVFEPHPGAQSRFFDYSGRTALLGGAASGGKSECLLWYPFRQIKAEEKRIADGQIAASIGRAIFFRRTMPELQEMIDRSRLKFPEVDPGAEWREQPKTWTFSCGYKYKFGQMEEEKDWIKYYGTQYTCLLFDELITFTEQQFDMLDTRLRTPDKGLEKMLWMRAGTNPPIADPSSPPPVGFKWVRKRFVDNKKPDVEYTREITVTTGKPGAKKTEQVKRSQIFIPALVSDNPSVNEAEYAATLTDKPVAVRRALLEGDWGQMYGGLIGALWEAPVHVCEPRKLPTYRNKFRSCCFTFTSSVVHWWAIDYEGNLECYRELHVENHTADMLAERIRELEEFNGDWPEGDDASKLSGPMGPATCWPVPKQTGPSPVEAMRKVGVLWHPCDESEAAVDQVRNRLIRRTVTTEKDRRGKAVKIETPGIRFFNTCTYTIETLPTLAADASNPDIPDKKADSVAWKSVSYAVMSRPLAPEKAIVRDDDWDVKPKPKLKTGSRTGLPGGW